jgi:HPt (histidine-containing phosphotransfer) domain-containing protein
MAGFAPRLTAFEKVFENDPASRRLALEKFLESLALDREKLMDAVDRHESSPILRIAHRLKGSALAIEAAELADSCRRVEIFAELAEWGNVLNEARHFSSVLEVVEQTLTERINN